MEKHTAQMQEVSQARGQLKSHTKKHSKSKNNVVMNRTIFAVQPTGQSGS